VAKPKTPAASAITTRYLLMPDHANGLNTAFGGVIMSWIDIVAAMVAQRHCEGIVVTASIDSLSFKAPIRIGDHVVLKASVNYVGTTSMEVGVRVEKENPMTGKTRHTTTAYLTFVHLDENQKRVAVPELKPETRDEIRRYKNARLRTEARKELITRIHENN
jgi:acyl-CoA hydrolase